MGTWVQVCPVGELSPGHSRVVDADGTDVVVFNADGQLLAVENVCTHDGGSLTGGCIEGEEITCPRHGARFSLRTGAALTPPAYEATRVFPVRVEHGVIEILDDRWD